jgi:putative RNA 2'-phosphotransferase
VKADKQLAKLIQYILGRRPDEYGLVPDEQGYVTVKELIKILHEEGWRGVRAGHLATLPYRVPNAGFEMDHQRIRAGVRTHLPAVTTGVPAPKQLYAAARRRAYTNVSAKGLYPQHHPARVLLFADRTLAMRVGRRRDAEPLIVTVQTTVARQLGIVFERFGEAIHLAPHVPAACCRLPAPPKPRRTKQAPDEAEATTAPSTAGSFILDWSRVAQSTPAQKSSDRKSKRWRRERQRLRRLKRSSGDVP